MIRSAQRFRYTPGRGIAASIAGGKVLVGNETWLRDNGVAVSIGRLCTPAFIKVAGLPLPSDQA